MQVRGYRKQTLASITLLVVGIFLAVAYLTLSYHQIERFENLYLQVSDLFATQGRKYKESNSQISRLLELQAGLICDLQSSHHVQTSESDELKEAPILLKPLANKDLKPPGLAPPNEEFERIWNYVYNRQYHCTQSKYLGGKPGGDGAYDLCIEKQFWPKTEDSNYTCLMYSFGVGGDFSFDDAIANRGCEVHSFDPSTDLEDGFVRESGVTFHKVGISDEDNDHGFNGWKMRTLKTLIKELGHTNRYLDYLKVDTDKGDLTGFEDIIMKEILDTGLHKCIRQYAMEIHLPSPLLNRESLERCRTIYNQMVQLNYNGWRLYNTTDNIRAAKYYNPNYSQQQARDEILRGPGGFILWETAFVNFGVQGVCDM